MYKIGEVEEVKILRILNTHVMVKLLGELGWTGILHISEVSDYLVGNLSHIFNVGNIISLRIIEIDEEKKFITFSYKVIRPRLLRNPNKFILKETQNKCINLLNNTMKLVEND